MLGPAGQHDIVCACVYFLSTQSNELLKMDISQIPMRLIQNTNVFIHSDKWKFQRVKVVLECDQIILASRRRVAWESKLH